MKVLSLFDGISCGQVALERAGIAVDQYFASEIDKTPIKVTQYHYPNTIQLGDISGHEAWDLPKIDLLIGGSPCQDLSRGRTINSSKGEGLEGDRSQLFWRYLEVLRTRKPTFFLLENVRMDKKHEEVISRELGVQPILINSNLVSYQNRERLYWTNIPGVSQPEDQQVNFQDFKDNDAEYLQRFKVKDTPSRLKMWGSGVSGSCKNVTAAEKINCITLKQDRWKNSGLVEFDGFCRYLSTRELELGQTLPVGYTQMLSFRQSEKVIGNAWTVDVIAHILKNLKEEVES
ncbi:DNA cytosine methyltransferase [Paenilisteria newyorkensis]|uniref:DNA cytosine methyltransferase n=1 Tax=Listeria newyorkensis TaxID=1497681 RepID=UPI00066A0072|nr:DNA cytosine methyltransferase [Listeria newyorkensis]KMT62543.1 DNA-cytosine methyltransferase [Listeria newyorkensis]